MDTIDDQSQEEDDDDDNREEEDQDDDLDEDEAGELSPLLPIFSAAHLGMWSPPLNSSWLGSSNLCHRRPPCL